MLTLAFIAWHFIGRFMWRTCMQRVVTRSNFRDGHVNVHGDGLVPGF